MNIYRKLVVVWQYVYSFLKRNAVFLICFIVFLIIVYQRYQNETESRSLQSEVIHEETEQDSSSTGSINPSDFDVVTAKVVIEDLCLKELITVDIFIRPNLIVGNSLIARSPDGRLFALSDMNRAMPVGMICDSLKNKD